MTTLVLGVSNVLGDHHSRPGGKNAGMPAGRVRMGNLLDEYARINASVVGLLELESPQAMVIRRDKRYKLRRSNPNNRLRGGNTQGTGIIWDPEQVQMVRFWNIQTPMIRRPLGLNSCAAVFRTRDKHQGAQEKFGALVIHRPRMSPKSNVPVVHARMARMAMDARVRKTIANWDARNLPGAALADSNEGRWHLPGTRVLNSSGVDDVYGTREDWEILDRMILRHVVGRDTDHPIVAAKVRLLR